MGFLLSDLRYAMRGLSKRPTFTAVAVLTLALGIGANSAIFTVVYAVLLSPLPYSEPDRLHVLWTKNAEKGLSRRPVSFANFSDWRAQNQVFDQLAAVRPETFTLTEMGEAEEVTGVRVSANILLVLGVKPALGRNFEADEDQPGKEMVAFISHALWQRRYGGQIDVLGQPLRANGKLYTIIGILPPYIKYAGIDVPQTGADIWVPFVPLPNEQVRSFANLRVIGRLKPALTMEQAQADLDSVARQLEQQYPADNSHLGIEVVALYEQLVGGLRLALLVLLGAVGCVLLIACANVASLLLARAAGRQTEMAVRSALGASRWQLVQMLLTESLLLSLIGSLFGLLLAYWGVPGLIRMSAGSIPRADEIGLSANVLGFTLIISVLTALIFGAAPAIQTSRIELAAAMKEGRKGGTGGVRHRRLLDALVIVEIALALVLLVGAGLMIRSVRVLSEVDPGFDARNVLTVSVPLPQSNYPDQARQLAFYEAALAKLSTVPGVESSAGVFRLPLTGFTTAIFTVQGQPQAPGKEPTADYRTVSNRYFRTMGIPLLSGREFTEQDTATTADVVIVNDVLARRYWPNEDPLGKRLFIATEKTRWREVIGVVGNAKLTGLDQPTDPAIYVPFVQNSWPAALRTSFLVIRTAQDPQSQRAVIRGHLREIDANLPLTQMRTMSEITEGSLAQRRFNMTLLIVFAAVAGALAVVGIYGLMAYAVTQRTHELGIRIALGAQPADILKMVVGEGAKLTISGVGLGFVGAYFLTRFLASLLYGVSATDPFTFVALGLLLAAVGLVASYVPARKAVRVDPLTALR